MFSVIQGIKLNLITCVLQWCMCMKPISSKYTLLIPHHIYVHVYNETLLDWLLLGPSPSLVLNVWMCGSRRSMYWFWLCLYEVIEHVLKQWSCMPCRALQPKHCFHRFVYPYTGSKCFHRFISPYTGSYCWNNYQCMEIVTIVLIYFEKVKKN